MGSRYARELAAVGGCGRRPDFDAVEDITPRMRRIRIVGESLRSLAWTPGQHIRLRVGDPGGPHTWMRGFRDVLRTYSVWDY